VLLATFLLVTFRDLTEGILVGFGLGTLLFLHRMAGAVRVEGGQALAAATMRRRRRAAALRRGARHRPGRGRLPDLGRVLLRRRGHSGDPGSTA
jgi:MFS superfamily sulfate permease-like transporter